MEHIKNTKRTEVKRAGRGRGRASGRGGLSGGGRRLLRALSGEGVVGVRDPARGAVATGRAGALSDAQPHPLACAEELVARDLAAWRASPGGGLLVLSQAGRAHLARQQAEPEEAFLAQHLAIETGEVTGDHGPVRVRRDAEESPLDWLRRRRQRDGTPLIDAACFEAGERLRRDLTLGAMLPSVTARWDASAVRGSGPGGGPAAATDAVVAARQRATKALQAVGPDFADLLVDLCGFLKGLETLERERGWPIRSAKVVVGLALRSLADHYGLDREARGADRSGRIRAWRSGS